MSKVDLITINTCNFSESYIEGAYYLNSSFSPVNLTNSYFINNTINQTDIALKYSLIRIGSSANISSSLFKNNLLINTSLILIENDDPKKETVVIISNEVLILSNTQTIILSNTQTPVVALGFNIVGENIKIILSDNVTFNNNYAHASFLYISNTKNTVDIKDLYLMNNFGFEMIFLQLIKNITITNFQCINNNDLASAFYNVKPISEDIPGNCLSIVNYVNLFTQNSVFSNNFATSTLTGVLIEHTSDVSALEITADQGKADFKNIKCLNNVVNATLSSLINTGNCFLLINSGSFTMTNNEISHNIVNVNDDDDSEVEYSGNPCLYSQSNDNILIILDSVFFGNQAYSECSCLNFHGSYFHLKNVSFIENRSIKLRNAFYVDNEGGCLNLGAENATMENVWIFNSSAMKGAGIFFHNKNSKNNQYLIATNVSIISNEGIQTSGIEFDASLILGNYHFVQCVINHNKVEFYGVISTFYYTDFNIYFYFCDISYNWGISAGAALSFYHFGGLVYINQSTLIGNTLNVSVFVGGAAIFLYGTTYYTLIYVKDCKFINNTSTLKGGAIQAMYGQVHAEDTEFIDNGALYGGAVSVAIYCPGSYKNIIVRSKHFMNQGGAFHFSEQSNVKYN